MIMTEKLNTGRLVLPIADIEELAKCIDDIVDGCKLLTENIMFLDMKTVREVTGWSKDVTQAVFNLPDFPSCDIGKKKIVLKTAFLKYFSVPRRKKDLFPNEDEWDIAA